MVTGEGKTLVATLPAYLNALEGKGVHVVIFFFNDTATTEIYTLSLHDALPIWTRYPALQTADRFSPQCFGDSLHRSEEHTSELQSHSDLVCRLLLEKKKNY